MPLTYRPLAEFLQIVSQTTRRGFLPFLLLLAALSACDDPSAEEFIQRAETYRQEGNISASIIELKNALQQEPQDAHARYLLGRNYLVIRDLASAEKELLRARDYGMAPDKLAEPLAEIWLTQRQFQKVLAQLQVNDSSSAADKAAMAIARARAYRGLGQLDEARAEFQSTLTHDAKSVAALVGIARIAMQLGNSLEVEDAVARAIALAPKNLDVLALKGDQDFIRGDYASAETQYQAIVEVRPNSRVVRLALARAQIFLGKPDQAIVHLDRVLKRASRHADANYLRASLALQAKDYTAAKLHSERVLFTSPDHVPSLLIAGSANYILGHLEQADRYLARVLAKRPSSALARQLRASIRIKLEREAGARGALMPVRDGRARRAPDRAVPPHSP